MDARPSPGVISVGLALTRTVLTDGGKNGFIPRFGAFGDDGGARVTTQQCTIGARARCA
jgi:hypothetical protein